jgi:hypothetical protein
MTTKRCGAAPADFDPASPALRCSPGCEPAKTLNRTPSSFANCAAQRPVEAPFSKPWDTEWTPTPLFGGNSPRRIHWDDRGSNSDALAGGRFSYHFGFRRLPARVRTDRSWSGLCLDRPRPPELPRVGRARPVSTPSAATAGGLARRCQRASTREFTDFERIPAGVSVRPAHRIKSAVSAYSTIIP